MTRIMLFALTVLSAFAARPAAACSCAPQTPAQALASADVAFTGTVIEVNGGGAQNLTATLRVEGVWKGEVARQVTVTTAPDGAMCGVGFAKGERYVVYAKRREAALTTNICMRSQRRAHAAEDLAAHGEGNPPKE